MQVSLSSGPGLNRLTLQLLTFSSLLLLPLSSCLPSAQLLPTVHNLHQPALVQHQDGRLFAVNAHLQPGQLFQTGDGRVFTLANTQPPPSPPQAPDSEGVVQVKEAEDLTEEPRLQSVPAVPLPLASQVHALPFQVIQSSLPTAPLPFEMSLTCSLIITLITKILDVLMNGL